MGKKCLVLASEHEILLVDIDSLNLGLWTGLWTVYPFGTAWLAWFSLV